MDGGGHDHGGHAMHGHGGDGGGFMDGGNHDHGHGGHGIGHQGGDGNFLSNLLGYNDHSGHHSFLSHLLGLDHDAHHGGHGIGHHGGEGGGQAPSQTPIWSSALQGIKLEHAFEGVSISINVWFAIFYALCIFWLFCIYWIRHHEPFANQVLGRGAAKYETAAADRRIIDNTRDATPIRTSAGQSYYAPMPAEFVDPAAKAAIKSAAFDPAKAQVMETPSWAAPSVTPAPAITNVQMPGSMAPQQASMNSGTQQMASYYNQATPFGLPSSAVGTPTQAAANGAAHMVATPMPMTPGAQRLKMIINK